MIFSFQTRLETTVRKGLWSLTKRDFIYQNNRKTIRLSDEQQVPQKKFVNVRIARCASE